MFLLQRYDFHYLTSGKKWLCICNSRILFLWWTSYAVLASTRSPRENVAAPGGRQFSTLCALPTNTSACLSSGLCWRLLFVCRTPRFLFVLAKKLRAQPYLIKKLKLLYKAHNEKPRYICSSMGQEFCNVTLKFKKTICVLLILAPSAVS